MAASDPYKEYCRAREAAHLFRRLEESVSLPEGRLRRGDAVYVNFAGNDYLGLSHHPALIAAAAQSAAAFGAGATASRLVCGNLPAYAQIEARLAAGKGQEAALVLSSGYQANLTALAALADKTVVKKPVSILADRLVHNSLLQGALLSGARLMRFRHNDLGHLEELLQRQQAAGEHLIVVSESVFGMDGDCADLAGLSRLAKTYQAMLYIDEAHATGVFGPNGFGLAAGCTSPVDVAMGTFGKALGSFGAYIASSQTLKDFLIQRCGGLIYSTGLPPQILGPMRAALDLLPQLSQERAHVLGLAARLREGLRGQGWDCGASTTQIIPVIAGSEENALALSAALKAEGFMAPAIRPPTVPPGTARLRFSLSAAHKKEDIEHLLAVMERLALRFLP